MATGGSRVLTSVQRDGAERAAAACLVEQIAAWSADSVAEAFPVQAVLDVVWTHGQHFVPHDLLAALDGARRAAARATGSTVDVHVVRNFLDTVLDKYDGRYEYSTYLALPLFELPGFAGAQHPRRVRDEWVALLIADALRFESVCNAAGSDYLPELRPSADAVQKRFVLAARALGPVVARLGLDPGDPDLASSIIAAAAPARARVLAPSMQPVYVMHDEYLFVRVLQSLEATFTALLRLAQRALEEVRAGAVQAAADELTLCAELLEESQMLFALLATMQPEAFRTFRKHTEGASAIQSVSYKTFEMLCGRPTAARLDSPAFTNVPAVREHVLAGADNIASALAAERESGRVTGYDALPLAAAMQNLESAHDRWKQTHYKIAVRMIGSATGTGYTLGTSYLRDALGNRLFPAAHARPSGTAS